MRRARHAALLLALAPALALGEAPRLELQLRLDPAARTLEGIAELETGEAPRFALHRSLSVRSASHAGAAVAAVPAPGSGEMREWRIAAPAGARLRIEYGGTLPALERTLDHRAVLGALPPMASPEGSFLPAGSGWYPAPEGRFSYRVRLELPAAQRGLVPGRLVSETLPREPAERYVAQFEYAQPADGLALMAGPYVVREALHARPGAPPLRLRTYFHRELDALADPYLADSARYIELFAQRIGPYPYTEFSVVSSPLPTGFGMPTLTYIGARVLRLPFIRATSLGHEVLHNWWGNAVGVAPGSGNWAEGLTTFMADYHFRELESQAAARAMRLAWLRDLATLPQGSELALAQFEARHGGAQAAVGYGKAAMVFVMLRDLVGDDAFERAIRAFWNERRFRTASWSDLQRAFEAQAGRALDDFFAQWIERVGAPEPRIAAVRAAEAEGRLRLSIELEQRAPAYRLRVPLELEYAARRETHLLELRGERQSMTLELAERPRSARLDPELRLWRRLDLRTLPPILRHWTVARAPRLLIVPARAGIADSAALLAERLLESPARVVEPDAAARGADPVLLVGLHEAVDAALEALGLEPRPAALVGRGTAQAWTIAPAAGGPPFAVVSARDHEALAALARALPHYGSQSYLVFEGGRAIEHGVWQFSQPAVTVTP